MLSVVGLGEALFDRFSPERIVLGGAPINLATHAHQLLGSRGRGIPASCVGDDDLGKRLLGELSQRGMSTDYVILSEDYPTGTVEVSINSDGSPSYEIRENVAWDHLDFAEPWQALASQCSAVCFGTLAQRSPASRAAIHRFLATADQALKVLDLNLRQFYYTTEILEDSLQGADGLKLNEEELAIVSKALEIGDPVIEFQSSGANDPRPFTMDALIKRFNLQLVALTRGERGTVLFTPDRNRYEGAAPRFTRQPNADSVGAGDACCAAITVGLLSGDDYRKIADSANLIGAYVASQQGATPLLPDDLLERV